jgi:hypothetical protein
VKNRNTKDITNDKTGETGQQENKITKPEKNVRRRRQRRRRRRRWRWRRRRKRRITRQKRKSTNNQEEGYKLRKTMQVTVLKTCYLL